MADVRSLVLAADGTMKQAASADTQSISGTLTTTSGSLTLDPASNVELAADVGLVSVAGTGGLDLSASSGAFKTSTGAVTISGSSVAIDSTGIDDTLTIGANSENIVVGASGKLVTFAGDVQIDGAQTVVGETTFQQNATFEGDTVFGSDPADGDTVSFANVTIIGPLAMDGAGYKITNLANGTADSDAANLGQLNAVEGFKYDQEIFVAKNGNDITGTGAVLKPFASITAAMAAITDASTTKRYLIRVEPGAYTEGALNLKPHVFITGPGGWNAVRVTATSFGLDASFTGAGDNRAGLSQMVVIGASTFNFAAVTSSQGKLYFESVTFNSAVTLTGFNSVNQAQFDSCQFFGVLTVSGVNVGVHTNNMHFSNIVLTQGGANLPTILNAAGGRLGGTLTATTTVNDFNRRISVFAYSFWMNGAVTIDGPSSYLDYTVDSLPSGGASNPNGGNLVSADYGANKALSNLVYPTAVNNPIIPATTNATNMGDWGKQWNWNFGQVHASTGSDLYVSSYSTTGGSDSTGRSIYVFADTGGINANVNGGMVGLYTNNATGTGNSGNIEAETGTSVNGNSGSVVLKTGAPSGTGTRGKITLDGAEVDVSSKKIINVADPTNDQDAATKVYADDHLGGVAYTFPAADGSADQVLTTDGSGTLSWADSAASPAGNDTEIQFNNSGAFGASANLTWNGSALGVTGDVTVSANLKADGELWIDAEAALPAGEVGYGKLAVKSDGDGKLFFVDGAGQAHYSLPDGLSTIASGTAVTLDFDPALPTTRSITLGHNVTFSTDNLAAGRGMSIRLDNSAGGSARVLTFPLDGANQKWTWLGGSAPAQIDAGDVAMISLMAYGTDDTNIVAAWSYSESVQITGSGTAGQIAYFDGTRVIASEAGLKWDASNDRLNIGNADNSSHSANLRVGGTAHIGGEVWLDGSVNLGDASADVITVNGAMSLASGASFDGTDGTVDLPAQFSIDGSAVSADVTAANLNTLTGGSDASSLHTHSGVPAVVVALNTSTNSLAAGDVVCADSAAALTAAKADADLSSKSARVLGVVESAGKVMVSGIIEAKFVGSLTVALGEPVYLSQTAGLLTNVAPAAGAISEVGIIVDTGNYAGSTTCKVALQIKAPIYL